MFESSFKASIIGTLTDVSLRSPKKATTCLSTFSETLDFKTSKIGVITEISPLTFKAFRAVRIFFSLPLDKSYIKVFNLLLSFFSTFFICKAKNKH